MRLGPPTKACSMEKQYNSQSLCYRSAFLSVLKWDWHKQHSKKRGKMMLCHAQCRQLSVKNPCLDLFSLYHHCSRLQVCCQGKLVNRTKEESRTKNYTGYQSTAELHKSTIFHASCFNPPKCFVIPPSSGRQSLPVLKIRKGSQVHQQKHIHTNVTEHYYDMNKINKQTKFSMMFA